MPRHRRAYPNVNLVTHVEALEQKIVERAYYLMLKIDCDIFFSGSTHNP